MLAILFLLMCSMFGITLVLLLVPDIERLFIASSPSRKVIEMTPPALFFVPAGIIIGITTVTMFSYYLTSLISFGLSDVSLIRRVSVLVTFALFLILAATNLSIVLKRDPDKTYESSFKNIIYYGLATVLFTSAAAFLMFYTYRINNGLLYAGYSTFSDLAPHTAMTSSFGKGFNFPTQYMHFSGDGIKYHFFFYYLCGLLEYLGLPLDWAINVPSIITMTCCFELLGLLTVLLFRRRAGFVIAPLLVLFRSSFNVFIHISELMKSGIPLGAAIDSISKSDYWYGTTPYDNWGIWAINVYPNQRHLMLGVSVILILVILTLPFVRRMEVRIITSSENPFKLFLLSKNAWIWEKKDPLNPLGIMILCSLLVVTMPYFHGSALIGGLLVLFGMALISESRLIFAAIAASAVVSSFIQTKLFSGGASDVVSFRFIPGFVAEQKDFSSILLYILIFTGLTIVLSLGFAVFLLVRDIIKKKPVYRSLLSLCFIFPFIFAFTIQVSQEMLANHKFIQITLILLDVFVAGLISLLFKLTSKFKENTRKGVFIAVQALTAVVAAVLLVPLTATGVSEWCTYINLNKNCVIVDTNSELTKWIEENTEPGDVFLTPEWSLNRFYLAGRPAYYGWPYYPWSAGHDTYTREQVYFWLISGCGGDIDAFTSYCQERGIRYLVDDPEFYTFSYPEGVTFNESFFADNLTQVAYFPNDNNTIIYKIY